MLSIQGSSIMAKLQKSCASSQLLCIGPSNSSNVTGRTILQCSLISTFQSSLKIASPQLHTRSLGARRPPLLLRVRAAAQKQKRENVETSKFSSPPLPVPSTPSEAETDDKSASLEQDGVKAERSGDATGATTVDEETTVSVSGTQNIPSEKQMSQEEIGQALKVLRSERMAPGLDNPVSTQDFWGGVLEETKLVEWPEFKKVLGTTGVVVAIIFGSSILLLTVNAILAELSDNIFNGNSEFAKSWTRGF